MLQAILKTLHLLALITWIGGMAFAHFVLRPSLALLEPPQRLALMHAVLGRFLAVVLVAAPLAFVTGFAMAGFALRGAPWPADWLVMAVLGSVMVAVYGHIRFVLYRRFDAALGAGRTPDAAEALNTIRRWVAANLALGVVIVVVVLLV